MHLKLTLKARRSISLAPLLIALICAACAGPTRVKVIAGPTFVLSGGGRLASFTVYEPTPGRRIDAGIADLDTVAWHIRPKAGYFEGVYVKHLVLKYGEVPAGYFQSAPSGSEKPAPLRMGIVYGFFAETSGEGDGGSGGEFYTEVNGPIQLYDTDHALTVKNGGWVEVNKETGKPYVEPADLEKYVREHQVKRELNSPGNCKPVPGSRPWRATTQP